MLFFPFYCDALKSLLLRPPTRAWPEDIWPQNAHTHLQLTQQYRASDISLNDGVFPKNSMLPLRSSIHSQPLSIWSGGNCFRQIVVTPPSSPSSHARVSCYLDGPESETRQMSKFRQTQSTLRNEIPHILCATALENLQELKEPWNII